MFNCHLHLIIRSSTSAVKNERTVADGNNFIEAIDTKRRGTSVNTVACTDCHRKRVNVGYFNKSDYLVRKGERILRVFIENSSLFISDHSISDVSKLCFYGYSVRVGVCNDLSCSSCIFIKGKLRAIEHNRAESYVDSRFYRIKVGCMVKVKANGNRVVIGCSFNHRRYKRKPFSNQINTESHEKRGRFFLFTHIKDSAHHFIVAYVKCRERIVMLLCICKHFFHCYKHKSSPFLSVC